MSLRICGFLLNLNAKIHILVEMYELVPGLIAYARQMWCLGNAVLELLAKKLRTQADEACEEFKAIARKLYEKPNCVEELSEMREWMKSIPETIKEHQELIDHAMQDYELIEEFYYNLSTDDFNAK